MQINRRWGLSLLTSLTLLSSPLAHADNGASVVLAFSAMVPLAVSYGVVEGSVKAGAAAADAVGNLLQGSGELLVKAVKTTANGVTYVFSRVADGASAATEFSVDLAGHVSVAAGQVVTASAVGAGVVIASGGQVIAFIPNQLGRALLHNDCVSCTASGGRS